MAKVKAPPPDPAVGRAQEGMTRIAGQAELRAAENDKYYQEVIAPRYLAQMDQQIELGRREADRQQTLSDYALTRAKKYDSLQDTWLRQVEDYDTEAERERRAGMAVAEVQQAISGQREQSGRMLGRMGINPASGMYAAAFAGQESAAALAKASAANMAREAARREGMALRASTAGMGSNYLGQASGFGMSSLGALGSGMGAIQATQGGANQNAAAWGNTMSTATSNLQGAANLGMQMMQMKFEANKANASAINGMIGTAAGAMMSDRRMKKNIVRIGTRDDGLGVYEFEYVWGGPRVVGVMADEVRKVKPSAVITVGGFDMVDYSAL